MLLSSSIECELRRRGQGFAGAAAAAPAIAIEVKDCATVVGKESRRLPVPDIATKENQARCI